MDAVSPVFPGLEEYEVVVGKDQPQYRPLPTIQVKGGGIYMHWKPTPEERAKIAFGHDLYIVVMKPEGQLFNPINVEILKPEEAAEAFGIHAQ